MDTYTEALKDIPEVEDTLTTQKGDARLEKTDIFRKIMWFSYDGDNNWHSVDVERVRHIQEMNKKGKKPFSLNEDKSSTDLEETTINGDLEAMDKKFNRKNKKRSKNRFRGKKKNKQRSSK